MNPKGRKLEEQRLIISIGLIASVLTVLILAPKGYWGFVKGVLTISALSSFLYILLTATNLKYKDPGTFGFLEYPEKLRRMAYDISIDVYGSNLVFVLIFSLGYILPRDKPQNLNEVGWKYYIFGALLGLLIAALLLIWKTKEQIKK